MLNDLLMKRCVLVAGAGGVGKTTMSAVLAIQAARFRKRVLVLTIDPAKRLAEVFGITESSMSAVPISSAQKKQWNIPEENVLEVAMLQPKMVMEQILDQSLKTEAATRIRKTTMYQHMSEIISGLQEYTAYEYVTRVLDQGLYDLVVLDTPPATHAKDFFKVPERITRLMESRVFQIFVPKERGFFSALIQNSWIEKVLGVGIFSESKIFFEAFSSIRDRILKRCERLQKFFEDEEVSVVVVAAPHESAWLDLQGLDQFLKAVRIPIRAVIINQVESKNTETWDPSWQYESIWRNLAEAQNQKAARDQVYVDRTTGVFKQAETHVFYKISCDEPGKLLLELSNQH